MRINRVKRLAVGVIAAASVVSVSTFGIVRAATVGTGVCHSDDFCQYKDDGGGDGGTTPTPPLADWSGDVNISNYAGYTYFNTTTSVNNEMDYIKNNDANGQTVWDGSYTNNPQCFPSGYNSTNMKGLENKGSSHAALGSC
jgi:hypothetical protein